MDAARSVSGPFGTRWEKFYLTLVAVLSSTILLKVASVQYLEYLYLLQIVLVLGLFHKRHYQATLYRPLVRIGVLYSVVLVAAMALAVASLRFQFLPPSSLPPLRLPVEVTAARSIELLANCFNMLYLATVFREDRAKLIYTLRLYCWTGVASGVYSLLCWMLQLATGVEGFGSYEADARVRGFYNEGGPYGLYVLSVFFAGFTLYRLGWERPRRLLLAAPVMIFALFAARSKAALSAVLVLILLNSLFAQSAKLRFAVLGSLAVAVLLIVQVLGLGRLLRQYTQLGATYERASHLHQTDVNYTAGRVAGLFIVPRMIADQPWTGIGWGNYATLRNRPEYRGAAAWGDYADEPSLGLFGLIAEFGWPLFLFFLYTLFSPFFAVRRTRAPVYLTNLAMVQPVVHIFGAQLNLTYPWVVTAFALGTAFSLSKARSAPTAELPAGTPGMAAPDGWHDRAELAGLHG